jgi:hypothetical protein
MGLVTYTHKVPDSEFVHRALRVDEAQYFVKMLFFGGLLPYVFLRYVEANSDTMQNLGTVTKRQEAQLPGYIELGLGDKSVTVCRYPLWLLRRST